MMRKRTIKSIVKTLICLIIGYWFGYVPSSSSSECLLRNRTMNFVHIGFVTDGNNLIEIHQTLKSLFLHRQSNDFLWIHILAPRVHWPYLNEQLMLWSNVDDGLLYSFNYTFYDIIECTQVIDVFQMYFDNVYSISFCKLIFPYLLNPLLVRYLLVLDLDILVLSHLFTSKCWLETIERLDKHPFAIFSIGHQGSPRTRRLPFPMPYSHDDKVHFHFNIGVIVFHISRIHDLDRIDYRNMSIFDVYRVSPGSRLWLRDFQSVTLNYLSKSHVKHSLTQVVWNVYMADRPLSFVRLNQGCNFQPCAQHTYVEMWDNRNQFPNIIIGHIWRVCLKQKTMNNNNNNNNYLRSSYEALTYLPISSINRINPTEFMSNPLTLR